MPPASGKYHRRQAAPTGERDGILGGQRLEDGEELGLGRPVVPFAVTAENLKELIHRLGGLPLGMQRGGEVVAIDLAGCELELAKRLVDFSSGMCYATYGEIRRVGQGRYLLLPPGKDFDPEAAGVIFD